MAPVRVTVGDTVESVASSLGSATELECIGPGAVFKAIGALVKTKQLAEVNFFVDGDMSGLRFHAQADGSAPPSEGDGGPVLSMNVKKDTNVKSLASAIAKAAQSAIPSMRCVGAGSVNQAAKAIAIAQQFESSQKLHFRCREETQDSLTINIITLTSMLKATATAPSVPAS